MDKDVDPSVCFELQHYIEELTIAGEPTLNQVTMKKIKTICKQSDNYVKHCFHVLMVQLNKEHSEIRLSTLHIIDELFKRSHCFRDLLLSDFENFLELTAEIDPEQTLPLPKAAAKSLRKQTLEAVQRWHISFSAGYKKLGLGYNFLKNCKKVDFDNIEAQNVAIRRREEENRQRQELAKQVKLDISIKDMNEILTDIKDCLIQMENCYMLLFPDLSDLDVVQQTSDSPAKDENKLKSESPTPPSNESKKKNNCDESIVNMTGNLNNSNANMAVNPTAIEHISTANCATKEISKNDKDTNIEQEKEDKHDISDESEEDNDDDDDFESVDDSSDAEQEPPGDHFLRQHGLGSHRFNVTISLPDATMSVQENLDNTDVICALKDLHRLLHDKYLLTVNKCLDVFAKTGAEQGHIKKALDIKDLIGKASMKYKSLTIVPKAKVSLPHDQYDLDSDDEDEFEEVDEKEGFEAGIESEYDLPEKPLKSPTFPDWSLKRIGQPTDDPFTFGSSLARIKQLHTTSTSTSQESQPSTSHNTKSQEATDRDVLLKKAPVVAYDKDLFYNWEDPHAKPPEIVRFDSLHKFWTPSENEQVPDKTFESMKERTIAFTGMFEPVKWTCRTPLSSGKLCERMDRVKCPFHGKIIGRNNMGQPTNPEAIEDLQRQQDQKQRDEPKPWQDEELHREIQAATGQDLSAKKGKGKKKKEKFPNLTDVSKTIDTARTRLERKVFDRKSMKRVAEAQSKHESKRFKDKFGHQFNYAIKL